MPDVLRISTRDIIRYVPDDEEAQPYRGDMTTNTQLRLTRSVSFWPLGGNRQSLSGTLEIDNRSGYYDNLLTLDVRDKRIEFSGVKDQHVFEDDETIPLAVAIADSIEAPNDTTIRISIADPMRRLEKPLGRNTDAALEDVTGKKTPVLIGVARNIRPPLADSADPVYRVSDTPLSAINIVRSRAFPLESEQWEYDLDNQGFQMLVEPRGPITCDASTAGEAQANPGDLLGGIGVVNSSWDGQSGPSPSPTGNGMPPHWSYATSESGVPAAWGTNPVTHGGQAYAFISAPFEGSGWIEWQLDSSTFTFEAGKTYRWEIDRRHHFTGRPNLIGGFQSGSQIIGRAYFQIVAGPPLGPSSPTSPSAYQYVRRLASFSSFDPSAEPGIYSGTWTCPQQSDGGQLIMRFWAPNGGSVFFNRITIRELPDPDAVLDGVTLRGLVQDVAERAGEPISDFDTDRLEAIGGSAQIGYWTDSSASTIGVIKRALDSYAADAFTSRDGRVRFARLVDPFKSSAKHIITSDSMVGNMRIRLAQAPGLTTQATARPNWFVFRDSDFVDNFDDVPLDMRARFAADGQYTVSADDQEPLPALYRHALDASPISTLYDNPNDARGEIERVVAYFRRLRFLVDAECYLPELPEPGEIAHIVYPRYTQFMGGRNMQILSVTDNVTGESGELSFTLRLIG
jgi:hypothetical protein